VCVGLRGREGGVLGPGCGASPLGLPSLLLPPLLLLPSLLLSLLLPCLELLESPSEPLLGFPPRAVEVHDTLRVMGRGGVLQRAPQGASGWLMALQPVLILVLCLQTIYKS
jgi:hypothetical protein